MLLATHRTAPTTNPDCNRLYMQKKMKRTTPLTPDEIAVRNRFAGIAALVKARKANIQYITTDQENFIAQKNQPGGCKTMKKYYWSICGAEWDQTH